MPAISSAARLSAPVVHRGTLVAYLLLCSPALLAQPAFPDDMGQCSTMTLAYAAAICSQDHRVDFDNLTVSEFDARDRAGLRRDTWYFLAYQFVPLGLLYLAPESVSGWSREEKEEYSLSVWWDHVTHPRMDSDEFYINYLLHPYWGGAYYVRAKERGFSDRESFWYAAQLSAYYEFGAEALFEQPSIQDLIITPVFGKVVGRYFMEARAGVRERESASGRRSIRDQWIWVLTDPLGAINRQVDRLFRRGTSNLLLVPYVATVDRVSVAHTVTDAQRERIIGIRFYVPLP